jgi:hypothetical protein
VKEYCALSDKCDANQPGSVSMMTYRIEVEGRANKSLFGDFGNIRMTTRQRRDNATVTTLVRRIRDQAELVGLMNTLHDWHLPILSVERLANDKGVTIDD